MRCERSECSKILATRQDPAAGIAVGHIVLCVAVLSSILHTSSRTTPVMTFQKYPARQHARKVVEALYKGEKAEGVSRSSLTSCYLS